MTKDEKLLADLYYSSNTVKFGNFKLAAHDVDSDLALSPLYMHFPIEREAGYKLLPKMNDLIGELFYKIVIDKKISYNRVAGIPDGAKPIGESLAKKCNDWPQNYIEFSKEIDGNGKRLFHGPTKGEYNKKDLVLVVDDHTSGGFSKSLFIDTIKKSGLRITDVLTVVDREQGAVDFLDSLGVELHSIFKLSELLGYYVKSGKITQSKANKVDGYIKQNQISIQKQ